MSKIAELKPDLDAIADAVNKFQSPAVQERVVGFLLTHLFGETAPKPPKHESPAATLEPAPRRGSRRKTATKTANKEGARRSGGRGRVGGRRMLVELIEEGYFKDKRSLNDILAHCKLKKATDYAPQDFSGALGRATREKILEREPNADGQFVYWKK